MGDYFGGGYPNYQDTLPGQMSPELPGSTLYPNYPDIPGTNSAYNPIYGIGPSSGYMGGGGPGMVSSNYLGAASRGGGAGTIAGDLAGSSMGAGGIPAGPAHFGAVSKGGPGITSPGLSSVGAVRSGGSGSYGSSGGGSGGGGIPSVSSSISSSGATVNPQLFGAYQNLLSLNQGNYQNMMNAYQQGQSNLSENLPGITAGYGSLGDQVQNTLGMGQVLGQNGNWGVAAPAAQAINAAYQQQMGNTTQQATSAGLGNTSVVGNLQNQNAQQAGRAYGNLGAQLASTAAGYQSQIGMAGLAQRMQGLGMQTGLTQAGLNPMNQQFSNTFGNVTTPYSNSQSSSGPAGYGGGAAAGSMGWNHTYGVGNVSSSMSMPANTINMTPAFLRR